MSNVKDSLTSKDRKIFKKQKKLQYMILSETGICASDHPEKNIAVCNAGLATELLEEDLISACQLFGDIDRVIMLPGKSYCFIMFSDIKSAIQVYSGIHGRTKLAQGGHPLYLNYVPTVPEFDNLEDSVPPEGLTLLEDFVSEEEEVMLLSSVEWDDPCSTNHMKHRRVKHYGYEFMYTTNNIDLNNPLQEKLPQKCEILWERLRKFDSNITHPPDQLTVNQYCPGQGIPSHVDTHSAFLSPILSLSLGSTVVMEFRLGQRRFSLPLPRRSLLIMDVSARYEWSHGITPRTYDLFNGKTHQRSERTSFTFRWVRKDAKCKCQYEKHCDTYAEKTITKTSDMGDSLAALIEQQHVHKVYDKIASHFNETRSKIWTSVKNFVNSLTSGSFLVDIGCGNGKNLRIRQDLMQLGIEYNGSLAQVAMYGGEKQELLEKEVRRTEIAQGDCLCLPLRSQFADAVISIAVFHHLATQERRTQAIAEVIRILRPQGRALITVWARDQARGQKTSYLKQSRKNRSDNIILDINNIATEDLKDLKGASINLNLPVHNNRTQFQHQDLFVPWKLKNLRDNSLDTDNNKDNTFMRYYHVFDEGELENLCLQVPQSRVVESFYEQGNWCVILEKV